MKTIELTVRATVAGEEIETVQKSRSIAEKAGFDVARNHPETDADPKKVEAYNKAREKADKLGVEYGEAANGAEADALASAQIAADEFVGQLTKVGVKVETATLTFGPRPGSHETAQSVDLTPTEVATVEAPPAEPVPA